MNISLNWLKDLTSVPFAPQELADRLTMLGLEVEAIDDQASKFAGIVVGEVLTATKHPNADKLHLTTVNIGGEVPLSIVCGAPNVRAGLRVAVAKVGTDFGDGFVIKKSKIRGELSEGMLCSKRELGISDDHEGILELAPDLPVGEPLHSALGRNDVILEIGITPNRPDCLSHLGVAREIAAITGSAVILPAPKHKETSGKVGITVSVQQSDLCPRYAARSVRGVAIGASPDWLRMKLEAVGLRSINNVVDVTNLILMEIGQPLHAFDMDSIETGEVVVRTAADFVESIVTLDGKKRSLPPEALLITDGKKALAIAGVMGGESSEICPSTTNVLIESAYFSPAGIRKTSKALGLSTDASYRFERGTDPDVVPYALARAAELIKEVAGGTISAEVIDVYPVPISPLPFDFRPSRCNAMTGLALDDNTMLGIFERLNIAAATGEKAWRLIPPSYRIDIGIEEDAIEEIARVHGYDNIPTSPSEPTALAHARPKLTRRELTEKLRATLLALGFTEAVSTPIVSKSKAEAFTEHPVALINPLNVGMDTMRPSLVINLLDAAARNERFGSATLRIFEIGNVFDYAAGKDQPIDSIQEREELALLVAGNASEKSVYTSEQKFDIFHLKGLIEVLFERLRLPNPEFESTKSSDLLVKVKRTTIGRIAQTRASLTEEYDLRSAPYLTTLSIDEIERLLLMQLAKNHTLAPLPKFPTVERDIALVLASEKKAGEIESAIRAALPGELLERLHLFDEFRSDAMKAAGERSLAFRIVLRSETRTLEEKEVDIIMSALLENLSHNLGAKLRT